MLHLMKYRLKQTMQEKSYMFWALVFPIILATFFYISFGKDAFVDVFKEIPVAVVESSDKDEKESESFLQFIEEMDGDMLKIEKMAEDEAIEKMDAGEIEGIFYDTKKLSVSSNSITSSILESILDSYVKNEAMLTRIAKDHPEKLPDAVAAMEDYSSTTEEVSAGGRTMDTGLSFFFALMSMSCLYGCFPGLQCMMETRGNLSALGARQCISPTHRMKRILANSMVCYGIHFIDTVIALCFIKYVLGINFGGNMGGMLLICLLGSVIGVSLGIVVGCAGKIGEGGKIGIVLGISMISCALAGLMSPDIKQMAEGAIPWLGRVNPATIIADAFYCLNVYNDSARYAQCLTMLGGMSVVLVVVAFLLVRRERYESI